jgi:hypothetical protein
MAKPPNERGRPRGRAANSQRTSSEGAEDTAILTRDLDELARVLDGAFVVVVKTTGGRYRRRCFLSVAAAERAAARAVEAGHNATIVLAELRPLYRVCAP